MNLAARIASALVLVSGLHTPANAAGDDPGAPESATPTSLHGIPMPARETEFITIFTDARRQYAASRQVKRTAEQVAFEERIAAFMRGGQDVQDWVGVLKDYSMVDKDHARLSIEIAPDITLATLTNVTQDQGYQTLIPSFSPMQGTLKRKGVVGEPIVFDASMLIYDVADDQDAVEHSTIITRFWKLRTPARSAAQ